ncbi:MAG: maleylpyruvate isomerase N-terminal domain-containing protein [Jatrophihabitans sp.]|uniref:maleylpyruvate isomerase N-terminal domain-containing protein n=1 Tax=Jatrophihabitans sp. TaxID=1932789 RepID=UPI003F7EE4DB
MSDDDLPARSTTALTQLRASTGGLLAALAATARTDADVAAPTLLPGWTRGHLLTHLARNADGIARTLAAALQGRVEARYPDGERGRDADIEAGATRAMTVLVADVTDSADRLDRVFGAVADAGAWTAVTEDDRPAWTWLEARQREVEFHRVDLAGDYGPQHWPAYLVARELPAVLPTLAGRSDDALLVKVTAEGSTVPALVGLEHRVGEGDPVEVSGPDWAVLAWLAGRGDAVAGRLTAAPSLRAWR